MNFLMGAISCRTALIADNVLVATIVIAQDRTNQSGSIVMDKKGGTGVADNNWLNF
jgi:hypothetical protein